MSTFACVIWCSRPPNSERDITDTQSRYANRKSYITLNCRRGLSNLTHNRHRQERVTECRNNFITSIAIFLRYSLVFTCFSFFISIELVIKRNRYICVLYLFDLPDNRDQILVNAYFQAWSIFRLTAVIHQFSSTDYWRFCFKIH